MFILFLAALVLCCCMQACSGRDAWASYCSRFYRFAARALGCTGFSRAAHGLSCPRHGESSQTRNETHVPCIGRPILNPWTIREVPRYSFQGAVKSRTISGRSQWSSKVDLTLSPRETPQGPPEVTDKELTGQNISRDFYRPSRGAQSWQE